ncbi:Chromatin modification- protein meaf6 [Coemansia sp. RSA 486]|nr:Chromatin modification- protein meaf6 [Coemansia sp. RSA 486]KAJ2227475.1 Chromatin modification- protein meaf6 [Coemansia sp. RSA 485]
MTNAKQQQQLAETTSTDNKEVASTDTKSTETTAANESPSSTNDAPTATASTPPTKPTTTSLGKTSVTKSNGKLNEGKITKKMLKEAEQELFQLLVKKKQLDRSLIDTESAIYDFETSYFENSGHDGNIVHGFDGYLASRNNEQQRRQQQHFSDGDRIFSQSSATFKKAQEARIAASLLDSDSDESESSLAMGARVNSGVKRKSGGSTIKHNGRAGTPTGRSTPTPGAPKAMTKKLRLSIDSGN